MDVSMKKAGLFEVLGYRPHPGQLLVHRSKASRRAVACGVRWGKSTAAAMEAVAALLAPRERTLGWVVGPTYGHAERIFELVTGVFHAHLPHRVRHLQRREKRLVVQNLGGGLSELRGKSADNPVSLLGEGIDFLIVDEAAQIKREVWDSCLSQRLLDKRGWALLASTPNGRNWFYRQWRRGQKRRDPDYESWSSPSWENPHLDRTLIEAERMRLEGGAFTEQYEAQFHGPDLEPCDLCKGPDPRVSGVVILIDDEQVARCAECRRPVDGQGHTLVKRWADGSPHLLLIRGRPSRAAALLMA